MLQERQQQRVLSQEYWLINPVGIHANEPIVDLDERTGNRVFDQLHTLAQQVKTTILVAAHDLVSLVKQIAHFVLVIVSLKKNSVLAYKRL